MNINILLFNDFETLDVFGPVEIFGKIENCTLKYYSQFGGIITSAQKTKIITESIICADKNDILLIPGGKGTRKLVNDSNFITMLKNTAKSAKFCLSVCTGSALLAKSGILNGKKATSNKIAMKWVKSTNNEVQWVDKARWIKDGKFYTSSGVSAGMDMALAFVCDILGREQAVAIANHIEYIWNDDSTKDKFAK